MLGELPALIAAGYEQVPEEDLVRLKWWGLYHDKPKIGTFMLRIKLPAGRVTPEQLRAVGELSLRVRQGLRRALDAADDPAPLPRARLAAGRLPPTRRGRADDRRRVRRRRPERDRLPRRRPRARRALRRDARRRGGDALLLREPGLLGPAAEAQDHDLRVRAPLQRAGDQLHRARRRAPGRRAGLRRPRRRRPLVGPPARARPRASSSASTRRYRSSARSLMRGRKTSATASRASRPGSSSWSTTSGPKACAPRSSDGSATHCPTSTWTQPPPLTDHMGAAAAEAGRPESRSVSRSKSGLLSGEQMVAIAGLAERAGRRARDAAAEPRVDVDPGRRRRPESASSWRSSGCRSQGTRFAPKRSRAPASRTATSPSRRPSRGSPPSSSTSRHASATPSPG